MIYIDLDSTLVDTIQQWVKFMNEYENKNYTLQDVTDWNSMYKLYNNPNEFFKNKPYKNYIKPFEFSFLLIKKLKEYDDVMILTDTENRLEKQKERFIKKIFKDVPFELTNGNKIDFLKSGDIIIDDKFETIYKAVKKGNWGLLYRHNDSYRYNDYIYDDYRFIRCNNLEQILHSVERIKKNEKNS